MSSSSIDICNLALQHIGAKRIQSLTTVTPGREERECRLLYEPIRDSVLADHDWDFARKRRTLALLTDTYTNWSYAYSWPVDCLVVRRITDTTGVNASSIQYNIDQDGYDVVGAVKFEVASNATLDQKIILSNYENAELVYTAKVTDTNMFSPTFVLAFASRLAAELAMSLRAKTTIAEMQMNSYISILGRAKMINANQANDKKEEANPYVQARG